MIDMIDVPRELILCDPDAVEIHVHEKQAAIIEELGGYDAVASMDSDECFIELGALYVNAEDLRKPPDSIVKKSVDRQPSRNWKPI